MKKRGYTQKHREIKGNTVEGYVDVCMVLNILGQISMFFIAVCLIIYELSD